MPLLFRITAYLRRTGMSATRFGRVVVKDPRFVHDLRNGREPRAAMRRQVEGWLDAQEDTRCA